AKTVDAQSFRIAGLHQRTITDQSRAQQRRGFGIRVTFRNGKTKAFVRNGVFCVTTIDVVTGEARVLAKVFTSAFAKATGAIHPAKPGNPDAIAEFETRCSFAKFLNSPDNLMTEHKR